MPNSEKCTEKCKTCQTQSLLSGASRCQIRFIWHFKMPVNNAGSIRPSTRPYHSTAGRRRVEFTSAAGIALAAAAAAARGGRELFHAQNEWIRRSKEDCLSQLLLLLLLLLLPPSQSDAAAASNGVVTVRACSMQ